jgi:transketolase
VSCKKVKTGSLNAIKLPIQQIVTMTNKSTMFEAFDWDVLDIKEGNNIEAIIAGMTEAKSRTGKPVCVLLHTEMGMEWIS